MEMEFDTAIAAIIATRNKDVDEYNELVALLETRDIEKESLGRELKEACDMAIELRKANLNQKDQLIEAEAKALALGDAAAAAENLSNINSALENKIKELEASHSVLNAMVDDLTKTNLSQTEQISKLEPRNQELESAVTKLHDANKSLQSSFDKRVLEFKAAIKSKDADLKQAAIRVKDAKKHKDAAQKHKATNDQLRKRNEKLSADNTEYREERDGLRNKLALAIAKQAKNIAGVLNGVWISDEESLYIHPVKVELGGSDFGPQYTLLYTNNRGTYLSMFLDRDGNVYFPVSVDMPDDINPRTKSLVKKYTVMPSLKAIDIAQAWLYRVNVEQQGEILPEDVVLTNELKDGHGKEAK